jgi:hypothetical protein
MTMMMSELGVITHRQEMMIYAQHLSSARLVSAQSHPIHTTQHPHHLFNTSENGQCELKTKTSEREENCVNYQVPTPHAPNDN